MSDKKRIRLITFLALYVAIYVVLKYIGDLIPIFNMPNGGSVEVELIAVCLASYHLGWKGGAMTGLLSWLVTIVLGFVMYFVHPVQIALDYVLPLVVCGLASLFGNYVDRGRKEQGLLSAARALFIFGGIISSFFLKYFFTVLSGAYFWAEGAAAGSVAAWSFSLMYNLGYNLVSMIVCAIIVPVMADRIIKVARI